MNHIMFVDDDSSVTDALQRRIRKQRKQWEIDIYSCPLEALEALKVGDYEVIVSDYCMAPINGVVFLIESKVFARDAIRIVLSGQRQLDNAIQSINEAEIYRYFEKPIDVNELVYSIDQALHHRNILIENERLANEVRRQRNELTKQKRFIESYLNQHSLEHPVEVKDEWNDDDKFNL
jgi:DNA-binding NtrC family response regulator